MTFPILDLRRFDTNRDAFLEDLRRASRDVGFFYLAGHGIPDAQTEELLRTVRAFFALPDAAKRAIEMVRSPHFRGYTPPGRELTRGTPDWREQVDFNAERPALALGPDTPAWARLQGPNQWPAELPALRPAILAWQAACFGVAQRLLRAFALALGQRADVFDECFGEAPEQQLKIIRYPSRDHIPPDTDQGCGAHKDGCALTLLLVDRAKGLQVETAHGWIDADPIPGTFIVNIGETLELASNGYLRATVHRVVSPPPGVERISVAFFPGPRLSATVPLLTLPPPLAAQATGPETDPLNPLFYDAGENKLKGRLRSHPDVARAFYADVVARFGGVQEHPAAY